MDYELIQKNFKAHGFDTAFFPTRAEAVKYLSEKVTNRSIGFGGSMTLHEIGLYDALSKKNAVVWHHIVPGNEIKQLAANTRIYFTSANAVSMTGEIVNIDGSGNRVAMTIYGPEQVYYIVGRNKIMPDRESALHRAKNVASPKNAKRLAKNLPCAVKGDKCYNCNSPDCICRIIVVLDKAPADLPSEVIFIDEDLGY